MRYYGRIIQQLINKTWEEILFWYPNNKGLNHGVM
jgi:hypothetical protein